MLKFVLLLLERVYFRILDEFLLIVEVCNIMVFMGKFLLSDMLYGVLIKLGVLFLLEIVMFKEEFV